MDQSVSQTGFFERKLPSRIILLSFPLLTVPLTAALTFTTDHRFLFLYIWLFGLTHFVLTISVYLQSENLRHFAASSRNMLLFFAIPLAILIAFYVIGVLQLRSRFPAFALVFGAAVRLLDFNHLNRQTFGVYQLFKARGGIRSTPAMKRVEQGYLAALTALLFATFLAGGVCPLFRRDVSYTLDAAHNKLANALLPIGFLQPAFVALLCVAGVLGTLCVGLAIRAWRTEGRPGGLSQALGYLGFQTAGALFAVVSMPMYFASLAIHYVEYHVLMFPRCFHSKLDDRSLLDRAFARLRRRPPVFYAVVAGAALVVLLCTNSSGMVEASTRYVSIIYIFDGLFVFHYFVEMLIWRFSDPFFRRTLTSLYFVPRLRTS
ncbi:MAG TPA: hypothetical protein VGF16_08070 [Bryobacteraceae bacterium]